MPNFRKLPHPKFLILNPETPNSAPKAQTYQSPLPTLKPRSNIHPRGSIYDPGSRFADPPPFNGIPPPTHPIPKPDLCDCAHVSPRPSFVTRIASQRRPIRVTVLLFGHDSHVRPPKPSTVTRIASQTRPILVTVGTSQRINKATVTRTAFPDRPDPCDSWPIATFWQLPPKRRLSRR